MTNDPTQIRANREAKDSVFTDLFSDKRYLLMLYKTLHPEDTKATEASLENITLEAVLTRGLYNDCGFTVGSKRLILLESQVKFSVNILVRALMYIAQSYQHYFKKNGINLYSTRKAHIPEPEVYIIYPGKKGKRPDILSLSKDFFKGREVSLEIKASVIYETDGSDIINQYIIFCKIFNEQVKIHGYTANAIKETIKICKNKNILKEYLQIRETEVITIMESLFNKDEIKEMWRLEERREAERIGEKRGRREGAIDTAKQFLLLNYIPIEDIAKCTGLSIEELKKLKSELN